MLRQIEKTQKAAQIKLTATIARPVQGGQDGSGNDLNTDE